MTVLVMIPWPWLQEHAHGFYVVKGLLALVATVLVVVHMSATWGGVVRWGQRLRYFTLAAFVFLAAFGSPEQVGDGIPVSWRNGGGFLACLLAIGAMVVSIREDLHSD